MRMRRINLAMHTTDRFVRMSGMVQLAGKAGRGVCAGCGAATALVKVHYLRPLEKAAMAIPRVRLKV